MTSNHLPDLSNRRSELPDAYPRERRTYLVPDGSGHGRTGGGADFKSILARRKTPIIIGSVAVFAAVVAITVLTPRIWESRASFLVERRQIPGGTPTLDVLDRIGRANSVQTERELIESRRVVEAAVRELSLHATLHAVDGQPAEGGASVVSASDEAAPGRYQILAEDPGFRVVNVDTGKDVEAQASFWPTVEGGPGVELAFGGVLLRIPSSEYVPMRELTVEPFDETVQDIGERVRAEPVDRDADVIRLRCKGRTPHDSRSLCAAIAEEYLVLRSELQRDEATATAKFLTEQVSLVEIRLTEAEDSLEAFEVRNQAVALTERATESVRHYASLRAEREQVESERVALEGLMTRISAGDAGTSKYRDLASFPTFVRNETSIVTSLVETLFELENRRSDLAVRRTENNPDLAALDARISSIESQLHSIATSYEEALGSRVTSLDRALARSNADLARIPETQVRAARHQRQVEMLEELYRFLQTRLREAEVAQAVNLPSVRIVDHASLPIRPATPMVMLNLILGAIVALGFGLLLGYYEEATDHSLRGAGEVAQATGIPVLSMIPRIGRTDNARENTTRLSTMSLSRLKAGNPVVHHADPRLKKEWLHEAFRTLSIELAFAHERLGLESLRSACITSSDRGAGKTFASCNLAIVKASQGAKTLLVDADHRVGRIGQFFGLPPDAFGLTDLLARSPQELPSFETVELGPRVSLDVLPSGSEPVGSADPLGSPWLEQFIGKVEEEYDFVIFDTPPLNLLTDAARIATHVGAVILIVRGGNTEREALDLTMDRLQRANARVAGIVLNDVDLPAYYTSYSRKT